MGQNMQRVQWGRGCSGGAYTKSIRHDEIRRSLYTNKKFEKFGIENK